MKPELETLLSALTGPLHTPIVAAPIAEKYEEEVSEALLTVLRRVTKDDAGNLMYHAPKDPERAEKEGDQIRREFNLIWLNSVVSMMPLTLQEILDAYNAKDFDTMSTILSDLFHHILYDLPEAMRGLNGQLSSAGRTNLCRFIVNQAVTDE